MEEASDARELRGKLRQEFLETVSALYDRQATVHLYGLSCPIQTEFVACRPLFEHFAFKNFNSPAGQLSRAIVRKSDVVRIEFEIPFYDENNKQNE
ncbi:Gemin7 domain containing protein [Trichuris trichiura]|uniref:Gemin7 domain containing protein n=1 Tax=Trichuris trichiura TaxID=36087 RepID=A0A077Z2K0_TRITR|nr:Gemin7 domain containing protein [Trichuris trichiura]